MNVLDKIRYIKILSIRGVPVYLHWSLSLVLLLILVTSIVEPSLLAAAFSFWFIMLFHELGHMWLVSRYGLVTYNINLYPFHGKCHYEDPDNEYENTIIAWGGVLAQFFLFVPSILLFHYGSSNYPWYINTPLLFFSYFNALIIIVNLYPDELTDGGICWRAIPLHIKYGKAGRSTTKKRPHKFRVIK